MCAQSRACSVSAACACSAAASAGRGSFLTGQRLASASSAPAPSCSATIAARISRSVSGSSSSSVAVTSASAAAGLRVQLLDAAGADGVDDRGEQVGDGDVLGGDVPGVDAVDGYGDRCRGVACVVVGHGDRASFVLWCVNGLRAREQFPRGVARRRRPRRGGRPRAVRCGQSSSVPAAVDALRGRNDPLRTSSDPSGRITAVTMLSPSPSP